MMTKGGLVAGTIGIAMGALVCAAGTAPLAAQGGTSDVVKRGEYLVRVGSCNDCHTPLKMGPTGPEPDMTRMLSGHPSDLKMPPAPGPTGPWAWHGAATSTAFAGPWGVSYAIYLTSDATGLRNWTEDMFVRAMRTGQHTGNGRPILPPMPWQSLNAMTDADLRAVFAYLKTVPPVRNLVPAAKVATPPASR
jgi:mono/diheme cytochrome c family protein